MLLFYVFVVSEVWAPSKRHWISKSVGFMDIFKSGSRKRKRITFHVQFQFRCNVCYSSFNRIKQLHIDTVDSTEKYPAVLGENVRKLIFTKSYQDASSLVPHSGGVYAHCLLFTMCCRMYYVSTLYNYLPNWKVLPF